MSDNLCQLQVGKRVYHLERHLVDGIGLNLIHVNGVAFAWWATATFGLLWYIVPRLTGVRLYSEGLARLTLWLWNIIIAASVVTLALGYNQGLEVGGIRKTDKRGS